MGSVVLASNVRAIAEHVIANKNGLLFEKENAQDLAEKLSALIPTSNEDSTIGPSRSFLG